MLRIAHISDLHIRSTELNNDDTTLLQEIAAFLLKELHIEVHAGGHDPQKLAALKNRLVGLRPDIIVVTGDLTNFGDRKSLEEAVAYLRDLRKATHAQRVICIPGNHDCLVERLAMARQDAGRFKRALLGIAQRLSPELGVMGAGATRQFAATKWKPERVAQLFQNFASLLPEAEFGACKPGEPLLLDTDWGRVAFFLFNSVNEPGLMANKGRIGIEQYNQLNQLAQDPQRWAGLDLHRAVRIALLHHHPIGAPDAIDSDVERAYDWMDDGPRFLWRLNARRFHLVLHGHQHAPFMCAINYGDDADLPTHIAAAGSASQGGMKSARNSFNVIDLVSPFEAVLERYDLDGTGFGDAPAVHHLLPLQRIDRVRISPPECEETVEDWAMRQLVRNSGRQFIELGEAFEYAELEFNIRITKDQRYHARYRRKGTLLSESGATGPIFIITGSPGMKIAAMHLKATGKVDGSGEEELSWDAVADTPNRKIIRVRPLRVLSVGATIDVTLQFEWQASAEEPNNFDGINLMGFRHPVGLLRYRVRMPWRPRQVGVQSIGLDTKRVRPTAETGPTHLQDGDWDYGFEIEKPPPLAYLIEFREQGMPC